MSNWGRTPFAHYLKKNLKFNINNFMYKRCTSPIVQKEDMMRKKARKIEEILEIPVELSTNNPKITITGFERVLIENYRGILEYQDYFVRINTYIGILNINGFNLKLEEMTTDDLLVTGKIDSIDFESTTEEDDDN